MMFQMHSEKGRGNRRLGSIKRPWCRHRVISRFQGRHWRPAPAENTVQKQKGTEEEDTGSTSIYFDGERYAWEPLLLSFGQS